jgi:hypothetical protein
MEVLSGRLAKLQAAPCVLPGWQLHRGTERLQSDFLSGTHHDRESSAPGGSGKCYLRSARVFRRAAWQPQEPALSEVEWAEGLGEGSFAGAQDPCQARPPLIEASCLESPADARDTVVAWPLRRVGA